MNINIEERMSFYNVLGLSMAQIENGTINVTTNYGLLEANTNRFVDNQSVFNACSISKFLTGILALKLVQEGMLNLDEDVNDQLISWKIPMNPFTVHKKVTLRNLLSHQSGIQDPENSFMELSNLNKYPSMVEILSGNTFYCSTPIQVSLEPVNEFHYSDAGYCIIEQLIADVTSKPFHDVMLEQVLEPLQMKNSFLDTSLLLSNLDNVAAGHHKHGAIVEGKYPIYPYPAACGLWTTAIDLAKLSIELMNSLKGESKLGLSKRLAEEIIRMQGGKRWTGLSVFLEGTEMNKEVFSFGWGKGFQSMVVMFPSIHKGAVIMTNSDLGVHQREGLIGEIYKSLDY